MKTPVNLWSSPIKAGIVPSAAAAFEVQRVFVSFAKVPGQGSDSARGQQALSVMNRYARSFGSLRGSANMHEDASRNVTTRTVYKVGRFPACLQIHALVCTPMHRLSLLQSREALPIVLLDRSMRGDRLHVGRNEARDTSLSDWPDPQSLQAYPQNSSRMGQKTFTSAQGQKYGCRRER